MRVLWKCHCTRSIYRTMYLTNVHNHFCTQDIVYSGITLVVLL